MSSQEPLLIDSHCHLNFDYDPKTTEDLVREAVESGVEKLITIGTEIKNFAEVQAISEKFENVYHTIGVHPHDVKDIPEPSGIDLIREASQHPKCVAIGEIGLDYYYDHSPRDLQQKQLRAQLGLAKERELPVVIHSRDGEEDLMPILTEYAQSLPDNAIPGVIHCFTGTVDFGQACADLGFFISFSGILTFKKKNENIVEMARTLPLDQILVETDSPFLAPVPHRGKKCEPRMVRHTAERLAEIRGLAIEEVARITRANTLRFFDLPA